tara:strand:- start:54 stop:380 length:327 start_codon:yes stop_codon:yes gene_type:complete
MKYLLVFTAFLMLTACENGNEMENAAESTSSAMDAGDAAMDEEAPAAIDEVVAEVMDAGDAAMADMTETMHSAMDDAIGTAAELEEAAMGSDDGAKMEMEQPKKWPRE